MAAPHTVRFTFASDGLDPTEISVDIRAVRESLTIMTITARFTSADTVRHARDIGFIEGMARSCRIAREAMRNA